MTPQAELKTKPTLRSILGHAVAGVCGGAAMWIGGYNLYLLGYYHGRDISIRTLVAVSLAICGIAGALVAKYGNDG